MSTRLKDGTRGRCIYCGAAAETTDHLPPRCFLERPLPLDTMTVPACRACNNSFSLDEQYAMTLLAHIGLTPALTAKVDPGGVIDCAFKRRPAWEQRFIDHLEVDPRGRVVISP